MPANALATITVKVEIGAVRPSILGDTWKKLSEYMLHDITHHRKILAWRFLRRCSLNSIAIRSIFMCIHRVGVLHARLLSVSVITHATFACVPAC
jgi:hypothetical protein